MNITCEPDTVIEYIEVLVPQECPETEPEIVIEYVTEYIETECEVCPDIQCEECV
jgi:hypothetical protein